jgi:hypothetical protein
MGLFGILLGLGLLVWLAYQAGPSCCSLPALR